MVLHAPLFHTIHPTSPFLHNLWVKGPGSKLFTVRRQLRARKVARLGTGREDGEELGITGLTLSETSNGPGLTGRLQEADSFKITNLQADLEETEVVNGTDVHNGASASTVEIKKSRAVGSLLLLLVAVLWGTYAPAMKYMYSLPNHPSPVELTALKAVIAAVALLSSSAVVAFNRAISNRIGGGKTKVNTGNGSSHVEAVGKRNTYKNFSGINLALVLCGMELGMWSLLGTASHAVGLQYTTATQGAFLIQSTALFTPVIAAAAGDPLSVNSWIGCLVGLLGSLVVTLETTKSTGFGGIGPAGLTGDFFILGAAFIYALSTVRLSALASRFRAMDVATARAVTLAIGATVWALCGSDGSSTGWQLVSSIWRGFSTWPSFLVLIWTAIGPGAIASFLQAKGQQCLGPAESQVLFASTPFWSALFAWLFLSEGEMGMLGWIGGCIVIAAGVFSSADGKMSTSKRV